MDLRAQLTDDWPLFGLVVRTPRLELRHPTDEDLLALARAASDIVGAGEVQPFAIPWHEGRPEEVRRRLLQYQWARRGELAPERWDLSLVAVVDGDVVGSQTVHAEGFVERRVVRTGSWLTRAHHGRGLGTEMRAAVLHLAFAGLGAARAETAAYDDNPASLAVTRKLGYRPNGEGLHHDGRSLRRELRFVLERADWDARRRDDIELVGLEPCLPLLGLGPSGGSG